MPHSKPLGAIDWCAIDNAGLLESALTTRQLQQLLKTQYERDWHVGLDEQVSKAHFLGYAARYIRRPPIAQHRFQEIDGPFVKFLTKDTKSKVTVLDAVPKEEFVQILSDHVPDKYQHAIRYYGLLSPRARARTLALVFALLGQKRRPRPRRLFWDDDHQVLREKPFNDAADLISCALLTSLGADGVAAVAAIRLA